MDAAHPDMDGPHGCSAGGRSAWPGSATGIWGEMISWLDARSPVRGGGGGCRRSLACREACAPVAGCCCRAHAPRRAPAPTDEACATPGDRAGHRPAGACGAAPPHGRGPRGRHDASATHARVAGAVGRGRRSSMARWPRRGDPPVGRVRRHLELRPVVPVSSRRRDKTNITTMDRHTVVEFTPSLVGRVTAGGNRGFRMARDSGECVVNPPTTRLTDAVAGIGGSSGAEIDKLREFRPTADDAWEAAAPLFRERNANYGMSAPRRCARRPAQPLHLRGREGTRPRVTEAPGRIALHGRRRFHGLRERRRRGPLSNGRPRGMAATDSVRWGWSEMDGAGVGHGPAPSR